MPSATHEGQSRVRPYREGDLEAIYEICTRTGDHGGDATGKFENPRLLADIFAGPYLYLEPSLAFVLPDGADRPVGYVLGTANTAGFVSAYREKWVPQLVSRYPVPRPGVPVRDAELLEAFHRPERMLHTGIDDFPAHLHIDILPSHQGQGSGRRLIETFMDAAAVAGAPGVHVTVALANARAHGFYLRVGFKPLPIASEGPVLHYGRRTALSPLVSAQPG
ncbi:MAG TPA: GNAT family N-acetyltransferase [Acidimicrobiales bacterium]|nr:GNAT family N-acetyltransferase [Acidimicrobiales bacterium]